MKDHPTLFKGEMVRAIQALIKKMTRREVTYKNSLFNGEPWPKWAKAEKWDWDKAWIDPGPSPAGNPGPYLKLPYGGDNPDLVGMVHRIYPKWAVGDLLWVKETHRCNGWATDVATIFYRANEKNSYTEMCEQFPVDGRKQLPVDGKWRPSIFMPRWASRITLQVTEVRVERLQDIPDADVWSEGWEEIARLPDKNGGRLKFYNFAEFWESINGPDSWNSNPWVWVITFTPHFVNVDELIFRKGSGQ